MEEIFGLFIVLFFFVIMASMMLLRIFSGRRLSQALIIVACLAYFFVVLNPAIFDFRLESSTACLFVFWFIVFVLDKTFRPREGGAKTGGSGR